MKKQKGGLTSILDQSDLNLAPEEVMLKEKGMCKVQELRAKAMCNSSSIEFSADQGCLGKQKIRGAVQHKQHLCTLAYHLIIIWHPPYINLNISSSPEVAQKLKKRISVQVQLKLEKYYDKGDLDIAHRNRGWYLQQKEITYLIFRTIPYHNTSCRPSVIFHQL